VKTLCWVLRLAGTSGGHPVQPSSSSRATEGQLPRTVSRRLLRASKDETLSPFSHLLWWQRQKVWLLCCWQILHWEIRNWGGKAGVRVGGKTALPLLAQTGSQGFLQLGMLMLCLHSTYLPFGCEVDGSLSTAAALAWLYFLIILVIAGKLASKTPRAVQVPQRPQQVPKPCSPGSCCTTPSWQAAGDRTSHDGLSGVGPLPARRRLSLP